MIQNTLIKIAKKFNEARITWALGASMVLQHYKLVEIVHDIDILIVKADVEKARKILDHLGTKKPIKDRGIYKTSYFYEYLIDGEDVDILCEFKIENQGIYAYQFDQSKITDFEMVGNEAIYYTSLEDWLVLYTLMERVDKINLLKQHFQNTKKVNKKVLKSALHDVSKDIKLDIEQWLNKYHMEGEVLFE